MELTTVLVLAALGGVVGLDAVSFAQAMISRPIVAGPLAGLILGDPEAGMGVGAVLEILTLRHLPVGAARQWDTGPAAVVAAAGMAVLPQGAVAMVVSVGVGAVVGWLGSRSVHQMRQFNARLAVRSGPIAPWQLTIRQLAAMTGDFLRAGTLTLLAVLLVVQLAAGMAGAPEGAQVLAGLALLAAVGLALGADMRTMVGGRPVWAAFGVGAALSATLMLWLS